MPPPAGVGHGGRAARPARRRGDLRDGGQSGEARRAATRMGVRARDGLALARLRRRGPGADRRRGGRHRAQLARLASSSPRSLAALAPGGRFLEIGKREIWTHEQVAAARPDVAYTVVFLGDVALETRRRSSRSMLGEICRGVRDAASCAAAAHRRSRSDDAASAFRYMAQARHIGKIVVLRQDRGRGRDPSADAHLPRHGRPRRPRPGGGRQLARGAGRAAPRPGRAARPRRRPPRRVLAELGAARRPACTVRQADVTRADDVAGARRRACGPSRRSGASSTPPACLDDGVLRQQTLGALRARCWRRRSSGAWHLHEATRRRWTSTSSSCFSSAGGGAGRGRPGQLRRGERVPGWARGAPRGPRACRPEHQAGARGPRSA